ncbi:hypothetical protein DRN74_06045 [Candidatus Micrarchaeota archaeon]|nr:MAG: hypothetical protein DRN74_06045 [Candidatus Micrarchaeota archaeon]
MQHLHFGAANWGQPELSPAWQDRKLYQSLQSALWANQSHLQLIPVEYLHLKVSVSTRAEIGYYPLLQSRIEGGEEYLVFLPDKPFSIQSHKLSGG